MIQDFDRRDRECFIDWQEPDRHTNTRRVKCARCNQVILSGLGVGCNIFDKGGYRYYTGYVCPQCMKIRAQSAVTQDGGGA